MKPDTIVSVRLRQQPISNLLTQLPGWSGRTRTTTTRRCQRWVTMLAFILCSCRLFGDVCGGSVLLYLKNTGTLTWNGCSTSGWGIPGAGPNPILATLAPGQTIYWGNPLAISPHSFATCFASWNGCGSVTDSGGDSKTVFVPGCDCFNCAVRIPVYLEIWPGGRGIKDRNDRGRHKGDTANSSANPGDPDCGSGMPVWSVSEPYETL